MSRVLIWFPDPILWIYSIRKYIFGFRADEFWTQKGQVRLDIGGASILLQTRFAQKPLEGLSLYSWMRRLLERYVK